MECIFSFHLLLLTCFLALYFCGSNFQGCISEKRVTELTLKEFLRYGPQREPGNVNILFLSLVGPCHVI